MGETRDVAKNFTEEPSFHCACNAYVWCPPRFFVSISTVSLKAISADFPRGKWLERGISYWAIYESGRGALERLCSLDTARDLKLLSV
jgi:hypothetical protein